MFRYVALGDSTGVGVGAREGGYPERLFRRLKAEGVPVGILNLAQSGATSVDVCHQAMLAASKKPDLVTVGVGTNDTWHGVGLTGFEENLRTIRDALRPSGARVIVSGLADLSRAPAAAIAERFIGLSRPALRELVHTFNGALASFAEAPWLTVVDLFGFSADELDRHPEYFSPDGFHPSDLGYERWAELMWPPVREVARQWTASGP